MFFKSLGALILGLLRSVISMALMLVLAMATYAWITTDGDVEQRAQAAWEEVPKSAADVEQLWTTAVNRLDAFIEALDGGGQWQASPLPQISPPKEISEPTEADPSAAQAAALKTVNRFRALAGLAALEQDGLLRDAALGHSQYLAVQNVTTHYETNKENPHYTAVIPSNRIALTSYWGPPERFLIPTEVKDGTVYVNQNQPVPPSGEVIAFIGEADPAVAVAELMSAPYHRMGLLGADFCDLGYGRTAHEGAGYSHVINLACARWPEPSGRVILYPAPDQQGVPTSWGGRESPDPYRIHGGTPNSPGYPLTVTVHGTRELTFVEANLRTADGAEIPLWVNHPGNDNELIDTVSLLPRQALPSDSLIEATVTLQVAGETVQRQWSFRTR